MLGNSSLRCICLTKKGELQKEGRKFLSICWSTYHCTFGVVMIMLIVLGLVVDDGVSLLHTPAI